MQMKGQLKTPPEELVRLAQIQQQQHAAHTTPATSSETATRGVTQITPSRATSVHSNQNRCNSMHQISPATPLLPVSGSTQVTPSPPSQLEVQRRLMAVSRNLQRHQQENFAALLNYSGSSETTSAFVDLTGKYPISYEQRGSTIRVLPVSDETKTTPQNGRTHNEDQDDTTSDNSLECTPIRLQRIPFPGLIATNYDRKAFAKKETQRVQIMEKRQDNKHKREQTSSTTTSTTPMGAFAEGFTLPPPSDDSDTDTPVHHDIQTPTPTGCPSSTSTHLDTSNATENSTAYATTDATTDANYYDASAAATAPAPTTGPFSTDKHGPPTNEEARTNEWLREHARQCPSCYTYIQKCGGNNKIKCRICSFQFCYTCRRAWEDPHSCRSKYNTKMDEGEWSTDFDGDEREEKGEEEKKEVGREEEKMEPGRESESDGGSFLSIDGSSIGSDDTYVPNQTSEQDCSEARSGADSCCYSDEDVSEVLEDLKTDEVVNGVRKRVRVSSRYEPEDQSELLEDDYGADEHGSTRDFHGQRTIEQCYPYYEQRQSCTTERSYAKRASRRARATQTSSHRGGIRASVKMEVIDLTDAKPEGAKQQITIKREVELIDLTLSDEDD